MAYQQTSASDWRDLLAVVKSFAVTQGWSAVYDAISTKGQLGLSKGSCHVALGEIRDSGDTTGATTFARTDEVLGGTRNDAFLVGALGTSLTAGNTKYWGHPGSTVTSAGDNDRTEINDLYGPFSNVWLFSNATGTYIHVVVQSSSERFTHFSFGNLDKKGQTTPDVGYLVGMRWTWWPDFNDPASSSYDCNRFGSGAHRLGHLFEVGINGYQYHLPDAVLDPTLGFPDGVIIDDINLRQIMHRGDNAGIHTINAAADPLDYVLAIFNQVTTGGVPMSAMPAIFKTTHSTYLGDLPDIRILNIANINPGQEIQFGAEVWKCFPIKRKTTREEAGTGSNPGIETSSIDLGFAYKKVS